MNKITQLEVTGLDYSYKIDNGITISLLENLNFKIKNINGENSFTSLVAPFGSGKSTLLKIICGLLTPTSGKIILDSDSEPRGKSKIVLINEKQNILPWLSVKKNIEFMLKYSEYENKKSESDIQHIIDFVGLKGYEDHIPDSKSKGFIFRIALANALIINPDFILLDEPFNSFSSKTRSEIYETIQNVKDKFPVNFLLATTNILEAIFLSDSFFLMEKNPGTVYDLIKIDRTMLPKTMEINNYISGIVSLIQNKFSEHNLLEIINFSL